MKAEIFQETWAHWIVLHCILQDRMYRASVLHGMPLLCSCLWTEGWPCWDDLLHTKMVNSPTGGSPVQVLTVPDVERSLICCWRPVHYIH